MVNSKEEEGSKDETIAVSAVTEQTTQIEDPGPGADEKNVIHPEASRNNCLREEALGVRPRLWWLMEVDTDKDLLRELEEMIGERTVKRRRSMEPCAPTVKERLIIFTKGSFDDKIATQ
jgi:hypothetical protein